MSILDILKKDSESKKKPALPIAKKKAQKPKPKPKAKPKLKQVAPKEQEKVVGEKKRRKKEVSPIKSKKTVKSAVAWKVLERPHVTEKATELIKKNEYVFRVTNRSNKIEIKRAVEDIYGVEVSKVRVINVPRRKKRLGKTHGWNKGYKKAIVKIKKGQEIEALSR